MWKCKGPNTFQQMSSAHQWNKMMELFNIFPGELQVLNTVSSECCLGQGSQPYAFLVSVPLNGKTLSEALRWENIIWNNKLKLTYFRTNLGKLWIQGCSFRLSIEDYNFSSSLRKYREGISAEFLSLYTHQSTRLLKERQQRQWSELQGLSFCI